ncbi:IclR family transcriptional regulator [Ramlibacter terrae]|uniref:IclR family transcriptional regulator n=1 Tax=Ramlibacter terrae TaxID=2732511 RepID=A0ABX6P3U9_9BURK|nr:IclR family transcriptional regulator [Ramlibacter terrae]
MKQEATGSATHRSLERGLSMIELLATAGAPMPAAEVARRLGLHRSTAHHLLQTLVSLGWLHREEEARCYTLSHKPHQLTGRKWSVAQLGDMAQPLLERLSRETGEGSSLAAWVDGIVTIAAKRESDGPVRVVQDVGGQRPMYCTAVGKAIGGWLSPVEVRAALAREPMLPLTPKTITTVKAFEAEMRRIRNAGYAIDDEEQFEGLRCVAMPVFCHTGEVIGSMCVVGPKQRMTHQKLAAVRAPLAALAREMSARLGHT